MPAPNLLVKYGSFSVHDSGAPSNQQDYTTIVLFNGVCFHSAIFDKLFPLIDTLNVRLVTANRPGYPGATPLTAQEQMQLDYIAKVVDQDSNSAANAFSGYIKGNAKKTHDFLVEFIKRESIPVNGGIVLAGWSLGAATILGFLANADAVSSKECDLRSYIKHVVLYDPPSFLLGYAPPPGVLNPFFDPSLTPQEAMKVFSRWTSAYYAHRDDLTKLEYQALDHPLPTILSMDPSDIKRCLEIRPLLPGGSDEQFLRLGMQVEAFSRMKNAVLYFNTDKEQDLRTESEWDDVGIKHVWCDQSMWEVPWAALQVQADLVNAKNSGRATRKVDMVRLRGGNHFCHWDQPDLALKGLLTGLDLSRRARSNM